MFKNLAFFCDTWTFLTLLVDYSCYPTWSIYTLARFIYYYSLCCCYCLCLYSYCFLYNNEKLTFLWHLIISNCCCLLRTKFYLKFIIFILLFDLWTLLLINILVHILIVLLVVYIPYYYFTINFSKTHFFVTLEYF